MLHKNRCNRRCARRKAIKRKLHIVKNINLIWWKDITIRDIGKLAKGKIHCSCSQCSKKSTVDRGIKTNSCRGYSASDRRKFAKMKYQEMEI